jgi:cytochrome c oxidase assembly protein subunit 15
LINGAIVPKNLFDLHPKWKNFFENRAFVQFIHRTLAYLTQGFALYMLYTVMKHQIHTPASFATVVVFTLINYQAMSGIVTLLGLVQPDKANLHQMSAMVTLSSAILLVYLCKVSLL